MNNNNPQNAETKYSNYPEQDRTCVFNEVEQPDPFNGQNNPLDNLEDIVQELWEETNS